MAEEEGTCGGVTYTLVTKAESLDLTKPNTTAALNLDLAQAKELLKIVECGVERLQKAGESARLRVNLKLGTAQERIFVPGLE